MDSDGDHLHNMNGMLSSIPPSISLGGGHQGTIIKQASSHMGYNAMLENHEHNLMFDTRMNSNDADTDTNTNTSNLLPVKRPLSGLFWNEDNTGNSSQTYTKRFLNESNNSDVSVMATRTTEENSGSIATLLGQLPQAPQMQQQSMLGSLEDGVFRQTYQLPGMNWYS